MRKAFRKLLEHLLHEHTQPRRLGAAVGLGIFVGCLPLYGLHLPICLALAWLFRLNKVTVYLAANISNPLMAPFLIAGGLVIGEWLRFGEWRGFDAAQGRAFLEQLQLWSGQVPDLFVSCLLGSIVLGTILGAFVGPLAWLWARRRQQKKVGDSRPG